MAFWGARLRPRPSRVFCGSGAISQTGGGVCVRFTSVARYGSSPGVNASPPIRRPLCIEPLRSTTSVMSVRSVLMAGLLYWGHKTKTAAHGDGQNSPITFHSTRYRYRPGGRFRRTVCFLEILALADNKAPSFGTMVLPSGFRPFPDTASIHFCSVPNKSIGREYC